MASTLSVEDYHLNGTQEHLRAMMISCTCISGVFVAGRMFVRLRLQMQFSGDDVLLILALVCYCIMTGFLVYGINEGGFGRKTDEIPLAVYYIGVKYMIMAQMTYTLALMTTNLSIAMLQLRIIGQASEPLRHLNYVSIAANVTITFFEFFALLFQCNPPAKRWTPSLTGTCVSGQSVATGLYVYSGVNIVLDWFYALNLVALIWRLQMEKKVKLFTIAALGVGIFASIAPIIRFKSILGYTKSKDQLYIFIPVAVWTWVELALGQISASISTFRPLVRMIPWSRSWNRSKDYSDTSPFTSLATGAPRYNNGLHPLCDIDFSDIPRQNGTVHGISATTVEARKSNGADMCDGESQRHILKEQSVEVHSDVWR